MLQHYTKYKETSHTITKDTIICMDSEVSSYWIDKGKIIQYDSSLPDEYYNSIEKGSCVYIWMCSVEDEKYYGRELEEFRELCGWIEEDFVQEKEKDFVKIFIQNLAYEFQVILRNLWNYDIEDVFARTMRKPMKCRVGKILFRCTYFMTNMSLATWGKQLGIPKLSGQDFDYHEIRTPLTHLPEDKLAYCERDLEVMIVGIRKLLEEYKHLDKIPLTNTGQVRGVVKKIYQKNVGYKKRITACLPRTVDEYLTYKAVFGGGDTHGNIINVNKVHKKVASFDETSAYPYMMFTKLYPVSRFLEVLPTTEINPKKYSYIMLVRYDNIRMKQGHTISYISTSRTVAIQNGVYDNGRVLKADSITMYVTHLDAEMIKNIYDAKTTIITMYRARAGHIDKHLIEYMLQLFEFKTTLKGNDDMYDLYMKSKNRLNSMFGMMVCDIVQPEIIFNGDWKGEGQLAQDIQKGLNEVHEKWWNNCFSYTIGLFITSWARYELWRAILALPNDDVIYFDTDSVKFLHPRKNMHIFKELNKERMQESLEACKHYGFSKNAFMPKAPNGKPSILGQWDYEGVYEEFKTLGAKKYCYKKDGKMHITVSGVPKGGADDLRHIEDFEDGFIFTADSCHKGLSTYLDGNNPKITMPDGYTVNQPFGINIREIGYTLGLKGDFDRMIQFMREHGEI